MAATKSGFDVYTFDAFNGRHCICPKPLFDLTMKLAIYSQSPTTTKEIVQYLQNCTLLVHRTSNRYKNGVSEMIKKNHYLNFQKLVLIGN
jgi:hypothetical protein